jgi:hypothetical protein
MSDAICIFVVGENIDIFMSSKCFVCFSVTSGTVHGGDSGVELKIPEGIEGPVKVKVLMFPENLAHSEDEDEP